MTFKDIDDRICEVIKMPQAEKPFKRKSDRIKAEDVSNTVVLIVMIVAFCMAGLVFLTYIFFEGRQNDVRNLALLRNIEETINAVEPYNIPNASRNPRGQWLITATNNDVGYCPTETLLYEYQWRANKNSILSVHKEFKVVDIESNRELWNSEALRVDEQITEINNIGLRNIQDSGEGDIIPEAMPVFVEDVSTYLLINFQSNTGNNTQLKVNFRFRSDCE